MGYDERICVEELKGAFAEKDGLDRKLDFWKTMTRKFPQSKRISEALHEAFEAEGREENAVEFWSKLCDRYPTEIHFSEFLAKSSESAGDYETAIIAWTTVLDDYLDSYEIPNVLIQKLDEILYFERDRTQRVEFWRKSLDLVPAMWYGDKRLGMFARALLDRVDELPFESRIEDLKAAAMACPGDSKVSSALRLAFKTSETDKDTEERFWIQAASSSGFDSPWPYARLAEYYLSENLYDKVGECFMEMVNSDHYVIEEVWEELLKVVPAESEFDIWYNVAKSNPTLGVVKRLLELYEGPVLDIMELFYELFPQTRSDPETTPYYFDLTASYISTRLREGNITASEQIQFWKSVITRHPMSNGAYKRIGVNIVG